MKNSNELWKLRNLCRQTIQEFWLRRKDIKDVLHVHDITAEDECYDSVTKLLIKTRKDFINGFSFFTRESIDDKIIRLMEKYHHRCMRG